MGLSIEHNTTLSRFEYHENQLVSYLEYAVIQDVMHIKHTFVPKELGGKGIAGELTKAALTTAQSEQWKVKPVCSYAVAYIERHPEYQALLQA